MPWITPNVFKQNETESLLTLPRFDDGSSRVKFRHFVHFYRDVAVRENTDVQRLTFETMQLAANAAPEIPVSPIAVTFADDAKMVPPGFLQTPHLDRVAPDVASFQHYRPLPLLFDIMDRAAEMQETPGDGEEFFIMTNSDIHFQPSFYRAAKEFLGLGYDVVTINRRTIFGDLASPLSHLMLAEHGEYHPGFDCFIFPARMYPYFVKSRAACGGGHPMRSLMFNLVAHAKRWLMLGYAHLTFHLGDSTYFSQPKFADYQTFNIGEAQSILDTLAKDPEKARLLVEFVRNHDRDYRAPAIPANAMA